MQRTSFSFPSLSLTLRSCALVCLILAVALPTAGFAQQAFKRYIQVYVNYSFLQQNAAAIANNYNLIITGSNAPVTRVKQINPAVQAIFYRDVQGMFSYYDDWNTVSQNPTWFVRDAVTNNHIRVQGWAGTSWTSPTPASVSTSSSTSSKSWPPILLLTAFSSMTWWQASTPPIS